MATQDDLEILARIKAHSGLRERIKAILDIAENTSGELITADQAEGKAIEEIKKLGQELLKEWAVQQHEKAIETAKKTHPNAKQLDINLYPKNERLEILNLIFIELKDQPIQIFGSSLSHEEIILIRDEMLDNPRLTFVVTKSDANSLEEAFYNFSYKKCLKKLKVYAKDKEIGYGFLFIGSKQFLEDSNLNNCM